MESKKGEITSQQLVIIIILVISFAIILLFLWQLNLKETTETEICHNSVISRGNSALPKDATPLNCQTSYICITKDGSCEGMTNPKVFEVKSKDEILKILADEMYNCWWMFGEGKVNYVKGDLTQNLYCSLCSQVSFDNSIKEEIPDLNSGEFEKEELYTFLTKEKATKTQTYAEYLYETNDLTEIEKVMKENHVDYGTINLDNQYYVMMGITSKVSTLGWIGRGIGAGIVAGLIIFPVTSPIAIGAVTGTLISMGVAGTGAGVIGTIVQGQSGNEYLSPSIVEVNSDAFNNLKSKCEEIETLA